MEKQKINLDQFKNLNIAPTRAKNFEELFTEVQKELLDNLFFKIEGLKYCINNNDIQNAKEWINYVDQTFHSITHKYCEFEINKDNATPKYVLGSIDKNGNLKIEYNDFNDIEDYYQFLKVNENLDLIEENLSNGSFLKLDNQIFNNLINEINSFSTIENKDILSKNNSLEEIIENSNDEFIKLNKNEILFINPEMKNNRTIESFIFDKKEIDLLKENKEYLNEIKTKFFNISKEREM